MTILKSIYHTFFRNNFLALMTLPEDAVKIDLVQVRGRDIYNRYGNDNNPIIPAGSIIQIPHGYCGILTCNGEIEEVFDQPGEHHYMKSPEPSVFAPHAPNSSMMGTFIRRITFGGTSSGRKQFVYYLPTFPIRNNDFSCNVPIVFKVGNSNISITVEISGRYTFEITEPQIFFDKVTSSNEIYLTPKLRVTLNKDLSDSVLQKLRIDVVNNPVCSLAEANKLISAKAPEILTHLSQELQYLGLKVSELRFCQIEVIEKDKLDKADWIKLLSDDDLSKGVEAEALFRAAGNTSGAANAYFTYRMYKESYNKGKVNNDDDEY